MKQYGTARRREQPPPDGFAGVSWALDARPGAARFIRSRVTRGSIPLGSTKLDVLAQILTVFSISGAVMCSRGFARSKAARIAWVSTSRR
jgi:hypothetical protein